MGSNTASSLVTARPLRNAAIGVPMPEYINGQVFKQIDVTDPKAKITKYLASDFYRNDLKPRSEGGAATRSGFKTTQIEWSTLEYAHASEVTDERRRNSRKLGGQPIQPDLKAVELCKRKLLMGKEYRVSQLVKNSTWIDGNSGGEDVEGKWAYGESSNTFITDIQTGVKAFRERGIVSGSMMEIRLLIDDLTFDNVTEISRIRDQIKYTSAENVTPQKLASILKIDNVIVASSVYNSAKETKAGSEFTSGRFWEINSGKGMAFLYAFPKVIDQDMFTAGLTIRDQFDSAEGGGFERLMKWREDSFHKDVYELAENTDEIQVCPEAGYLFKDTILT